MFTGIDFYSDTMTKPSEDMKKFMMKAQVGDEQQGEDPTTKKLEEVMASRLGKTAALFFPSATLCNQIAVYMHCQPGDEIIGADSSHIFNSEGGGAAFHARAQARMIKTKNGIFDREQLSDHFRLTPGHHAPKSAMILVENTNNGSGGTCWSPAQLSPVIAFAKEFHLKTHLDGARLFNAAVAVDADIKQLAHGFDTVTICFSKGLGCPTGAVLAFDREHFERVRRLKQVFGGAMRQSGILAAACLYAIDHHVSQLTSDHANAQSLALRMKDVAGIVLENEKPDSNMVFFKVDESRMSPDKFLEACIANNLRFSRVGKNRFRAVTHRDVNKAQVEESFSILKRIFS
jgi:threonine aldolase